MLSVGIHENIIIDTAGKDDAGHLKITFKSAGEEDPLAGLNSSTDTSATDGNSSDIRLFSPSVTNWEKQRDEPEVNLRKIKEVKDQLHHILKHYMREDEIKWEVNANIEGLTMTNIFEKIGDQSVMDQMYDNLANQFISQLGPKLDSSKKFRVLFVRQSKAKHYPTLRKKYLNTQPFMEPMSVPAEQSQLKFTSYEIQNDLDNPGKIEEDQKVGGEGQDAAKLFSSQG